MSRLSVKSPDIAKQVDQRAMDLSAEFLAHRDEFISAHPDMTDERLIFEGWTMQKIAGLHVIVTELVKSITTQP